MTVLLKVILRIFIEKPKCSLNQFTYIIILLQQSLYQLAVPLFIFA